MHFLRRRVSASDLKSDTTYAMFSNGNSVTRNKDRTFGIFFWLLIIVSFAFICYSGSSSFSACLPKSVLQEGQVQFKEHVARHHLKTMTKVGPRVVGTYQNEHFAQTFLLNYLSLYANKSFGPLYTQLSHQLSGRGNFSLHFLEIDFTSTYENIQNIAFRISTSKSMKKSALLINCHYDSFIGSPAASDDFINCAVMMDVIRVLLEKKEPLLNDVIFLFNGAEENVMQGSHAFVTQHNWAKDCRVAINLDAGGTEGRQILFQVSPDSRWLLNIYREVINNPLATVIGQEIFEYGLIPSDTDFRIFTNSSIPGVDLAFIKNGYLYHTLFDTEEKFSTECLQLSGDNLLAFVSNIANSSYLTYPPHSAGKSLFFDVLGYFLFFMSDRMYYFISLLTLLAVYCQAFQLIKQQRHWKLFGVVWCMELLTILGMLVTSLFVGLLHHFCLTRMAWYSNRYIVLTQYLCPIILFVLYFRACSFYKFDLNHFDATVVQKLSFFSLLIIYGSVVMLMNMFGILSSYIIMIWVFFPFMCYNLLPIVFNTILTNVMRVFKVRHFQFSEQFQELLFSLFAYGTPLLHYSQIFQLLIDALIPICGRAGLDVMPDAVISIVILAYCLPPASYLTASYLHKTKLNFYYRVRICLLFVTLFSVILVNISPLGFPYSADKETPRPQRIFSFDMSRTIRNEFNKVILEDNGLVILSLDSNSLSYLSEEVRYLKNYRKYYIPCFDLPYCGISHILPVAHMFPDLYYVPSSRARRKLTPMPKLTVVDKEIHSQSAMLSINVTGPSLNHIFVMTKFGVDLIEWSLDPTNKPKPTLVNSEFSSKHYFVFNSYGLKSNQPLNIVLKFHIEPKTLRENRFVEIALSGIYTDKNKVSTPAIKELKSMLPDWVAYTHFASEYNHFHVMLR